MTRDAGPIVDHFSSGGIAGKSSERSGFAIVEREFRGDKGAVLSAIGVDCNSMIVMNCIMLMLCVLCNCGW